LDRVQANDYFIGPETQPIPGAPVTTMSLILSLAPTNESKLSSFPASELVLIVILNRSHQESSWSDGKPIDLLLLRLEALLTNRGICWEKEKGALLLLLLDLLSEKKMKALNVFLVS
jgi:hypothetical protein